MQAFLGALKGAGFALLFLLLVLVVSLGVTYVPITTVTLVVLLTIGVFAWVGAEEATR